MNIGVAMRMRHTRSSERYYKPQWCSARTKVDGCHAEPQGVNQCSRVLARVHLDDGLQRLHAAQARELARLIDGLNAAVHGAGERGCSGQIRRVNAAALADARDASAA